jgi:hypothetical protein
MDIKNYTTVIVLFPPRMGGNHLANMISTSPKISNRSLKESDEKYKIILDEYYSSTIKNAHVGDIAGVGVFNPNEVYQIIKKADKPFIIAGHIDETYYVFQTIKDLSPFLFIYFEWQTLTDIINQRINFNDTTLTRWAYSGNVISKIFETTKDNMYWINPNDLFNLDITNFLTAINNNLNLNLDLDFCLSLHKKWFRKI